jgi:hypothetical protein
MQCPSRLPLVGYLTALGLLATVGACDVQTGLVARNGCPVGESAHVRVPLTRVVGN